MKLLIFDEKIITKYKSNKPVAISAINDGVICIFINEILEGTNTYYYFISSTSKTILLSSSDNKDEARELALEKLAPNIKNLIGKNVILVTVKNTEKKYKKDATLTGGPISFELETEIIKSSDKIKSGDKSKRNVYLSEKFIKKNIDDITIKLKDIVFEYFVIKNWFRKIKKTDFAK